MKSYQKIHSFSQRPSCPQIASWLIIIAQIIVFYLCIQLNYSSITLQIVFNVLFSLFLLITLILWIIVSLSDPSDSIMTSLKSPQEDQRNEIKRKIANLKDSLFYCGQCRTYVHRTSKHCRICDRCVQNFDHHCIWLNNCVGSTNYSSFMVLIIFFQIKLTVFLISLAFLWAQAQWENYLISMIINWIQMGIIIVFWVLNLILVVLHLYLIYRDQTTYQFFYERKKVSQNKIYPLERTQQALHNQGSRISSEQNTITEIISKKNKEEMIMMDESKERKKIVSQMRFGQKTSEIRRDSEWSLKKAKSLHSLFSDINIFQPS